MLICCTESGIIFLILHFFHSRDALCLNKYQNISLKCNIHFRALNFVIFFMYNLRTLCYDMKFYNLNLRAT